MGGEEEEAVEERWEEIMLIRCEAIRGDKFEVDGRRSCLESIAREASQEVGIGKRVEIRLIRLTWLQKSRLSLFASSTSLSERRLTFHESVRSSHLPLGQY